MNVLFHLCNFLSMLIRLQGCLDWQCGCHASPGFVAWELGGPFSSGRGIHDFDEFSRVYDGGAARCMRFFLINIYIPTESITFFFLGCKKKHRFFLKKPGIQISLPMELWDKVGNGFRVCECSTFFSTQTFPRCPGGKQMKKQSSRPPNFFLRKPLCFDESSVGCYKIPI